MQTDKAGQEIMSILEMVEKKTITPEQAARLLEAMETEQPGATPRRTLHIAVTDTRTGRQKVDVNIPLGLVEVASRLGLTLGVKSAPQLADVNFDEIMTAIKNGADGEIVDINDEDERQRVVVALN